mgnify:CR=1 FL=1
MYINSNSMATNVTNNLTSHYNDLKTSTSRLSSGLRVNSAADDAAGLVAGRVVTAGQDLFPRSECTKGGTPR